jgi:hypothetical protein
MINVKDMPRDEMIALLQRAGFGHLGCTRDNIPYVVPMHYALDLILDRNPTLTPALNQTKIGS